MFQFEPEHKKRVVIRPIRQKLNVFTLQLPIYYILEQEISIGCKCGHREKSCRELDAMLIASAKIPEREGSILPSNFYGQLPVY